MMEGWAVEAQTGTGRLGLLQCAHLKDSEFLHVVAANNVWPAGEDLSGLDAGRSEITQDLPGCAKCTRLGRQARERGAQSRAASHLGPPRHTVRRVGEFTGRFVKGKVHSWARLHLICAARRETLVSPRPRTLSSTRLEKNRPNFVTTSTPLSCSQENASERQVGGGAPLWQQTRSARSARRLRHEGSVATHHRLRGLCWRSHGPAVEHLG